MRSAEDVCTEITEAIMSCYVPDPGMAKAMSILEADRREAKLEVLREYRRRVASEEGWNFGTNGVADNMISELEGKGPRWVKKEDPDAE